MAFHRVDDGGGLVVLAAQEAHFVSRFVSEHAPALGRWCTSADLRRALERYIDVSRDNLDRTEAALATLCVTPAGRTSPGVEGLLAGADALCQAVADPDMRDVALQSGLEAVRLFDTWRATTLNAWCTAFRLGEVCAIVQRNLGELEGVRVELAAVERSLILAASAAKAS